MKKKKSPEVLPVSDIANKVRAEYFPMKLKGGVTCEIATREEMLACTAKIYRKVFVGRTQTVQVIKPNSKELKGFRSTYTEYLKTHTEYFLFRKNGKAIGWSYGEMDDFETFYMRNTGILPEYQKNGFYSEFLENFLGYLKEIGYQRVSSQHNGHNIAIFRAKMAQGFIIVGNENHERWGHLVKLVKIFDPRREKIYRARF